MADDQEKTEDPTPKKLEDARQKGEVAMSREFANFVVFLGFALSFYFSGPFMLRKITEILTNTFRFYPHLLENQHEFYQFLMRTTEDIVWIVAPIFGAVFLFGIFAYTGQFGILFATEKIQPKPEKLNPLEGLKKIFSRETLVELIKSIIKVGGLSAIFYLIFKSEFHKLLELSVDSIPDIFYFSMMIIGKLGMAFLIFLAVLGIGDFAFQKWSFHERQKMSLQEVKDEMKQREGDPHIKSRIRQLQREAARSRMMSDVPQADVVVANPVHVAVALKYERGIAGAPKIVAKGAGVIAQKIKEIAAENAVPVLERKQLARYLYRNVEVGQYIPEGLYSAVAEVLAYVYKMKKKYRSLGGWIGDAHALRPRV